MIKRSSKHSRRPSTTHKSAAAARPKQGKEYEQVVAAVARAFGGASLTVTEGPWVVGPDGRRELDVLIEGTENGTNVKAIVECKDFNPATTGPVGIGYIDALESKRRDLNATFATICSNAGFTADAERKAARVGIGLFSVLKMGDKRIRFSVIDEVYGRKVQVSNLGFTLWNESARLDLGGATTDTILAYGAPVANWVMNRAMHILLANRVVEGHISGSLVFSKPLELQWPGHSGLATKLEFSFDVAGSWYAHRVEIDSSTGIYDWLRRRIRVAPGEGMVQIRGIDFHGGTQIDHPPERVLNPPPMLPGEKGMGYLKPDGIELRAIAPDLDSCLTDEDRDLRLVSR